ncbi:MAG: M48 family metalloprotease [Gammaproteobacteria bacterium]|nr:M48 family metalloprotease [Gammaproteobacteria bacterium]
MSKQSYYPESPQGVPSELTEARASYKRRAWFALAGLVCFIGFYVAMTFYFGLVSYKGMLAIKAGHAGLWQMVITGSVILLTVFMAKSLFAVRKVGQPGGVEVSSEDEPHLFEFLYTLSDEIGAPKPHRVFITSEVNAAVFYDLSLVNLIFPSKKNLIVGLGLVNVLNLGEFKAVLAHEFGHFSQGSMMVGRWVYTAQQIISHMVGTRDWLDSLLKFVSRIDIRIAWLGWLLTLIVWSIRSLMDSLFKLVIIAERALSREMEFNADLVAVSITGSDALIHALHKLQNADQAWQTALSIASKEAADEKILEDIFLAQTAVIEEMRRVLNNPEYAATPKMPDLNRHDHRIFHEESALPPQMWATHPANSDREENAKQTYVAADIDDRSSWELFVDPGCLRRKLSLIFYPEEKVEKMQLASPFEAVKQRYAKAWYSPEYRGVYLSRSSVRNFSDIDAILSGGNLSASATESLAKLYPESLADDLEAARNLDVESSTLEALGRGELKPSGGVIRHRGEELRKDEIPDAIKQIVTERREVGSRLMAHDASCRRAHLQAAEQLGGGWKEYLLSLIHLLHCVEHLSACVDDERALFENTWQIIMADGKVSAGERKRLLKVCVKFQGVMNEVSARIVEIQLPSIITEALGVESWSEQCLIFDFVQVDKNNLGDWCSPAYESASQVANALQVLAEVTLEELINTEESLRRHLLKSTLPGDAPQLAVVPSQYPILLPGNENELQRKLGFWDSFQLAHGFVPSACRLTVSLTIVGGTIYGGYLGI